jgi:hypothetical protein
MMAKGKTVPNNRYSFALKNSDLSCGIFTVFCFQIDFVLIKFLNTTAWFHLISLTPFMINHHRCRRVRFQQRLGKESK